MAVIDINQHEFMRNRPREDQVKAAGMLFGMYQVDDHNCLTGGFWRRVCLDKKAFWTVVLGQKFLDFVNGTVQDTTFTGGVISSVHQFGGPDAFQESCFPKKFLQTIISIIEILSCSTLQYPYQQWIYLQGLYMRIMNLPG